MADDSVMIRVQRATVARLKAMIRQLAASVEAGRTPDPGVRAEQINPNAGPLSMDQIVNLLLDARDRHQAAAARSAEKRKRCRTPVD